jgi:hypothetical protein
MFKFLSRRGCEDMPIILAGNFNVNMKNTFELDVLLDLSEGMTRSNSCIDVVNVDNLSCMNYVLLALEHNQSPSYSTH